MLKDNIFSKNNIFKFYSLLTLLILMSPSLIGQVDTHISSDYEFHIISNNKPCNLIISQDYRFEDNNSDNRLDAGETASIIIYVKNKGEGIGKNLKLNVKDNNKIKGLIIDGLPEIPKILPGQTIPIKFSVTGTKDLQTGEVKLAVYIDEKRSGGSNEMVLSFSALKFLDPLLAIIDPVFTSKERTFNRVDEITLEFLVQNQGQGLAKNTIVILNHHDKINPSDGGKIIQIGNLESNQSRHIQYKFTIPRSDGDRNSNFSKSNDFDFKIRAEESRANFSVFQIKKLLLNTEVTDKVIAKVNSQAYVKKDIKLVSLNSEVDKNIPNNNISKQHSYALIIGNEDYTSYQMDLSSEVNVDFANNDATIFKEYCQKTLGVPLKHIKLLNNATKAQMSQGIAWLKGLAETEGGNAEIIFYYSGHGLPDEQTKEGYLIPVDVSGTNVTSGISLNSLFNELSKYPTKRTTVFLDACFSGGARNEGLVAMKGVRIKPKEEIFRGNMVVFSSSSGNESSGVYREKQHGFFTYFLLKKMQETKGAISYKEMADYLNYSVKKETAIIGKVQTPQLDFSSSIANTWKNWKFYD